MQCFPEERVGLAPGWAGILNMGAAKRSAAWLIAAICVSSLYAAMASAQPNVILVTLDGVRWREVFQGVDPLLTGERRSQKIFRRTFSMLEGRGAMFGDRSAGNGFSSSNLALVSLPGYRSIMTGKFDLFCISNECGRIGEESVQERLVRELKLAPHQVATIGSWPEIALAVERKPGSTFVQTGILGALERTHAEAFPQIKEFEPLDARPRAKRPDRDTFAYALDYLTKYRPRFLYIALDESDAYGDRNDYAGHVAMLNQYDLWIKQLLDLIAGMGEYGRETTVLITTDHGRGEIGRAHV